MSSQSRVLSSSYIEVNSAFYCARVVAAISCGFNQNGYVFFGLETVQFFFFQNLEIKKNCVSIRNSDVHQQLAISFLLKRKKSVIPEGFSLDSCTILFIAIHLLTTILPSFRHFT